MLDRLLRLTTLGGALVLSGLLEQDEGAISSALAEHQQPEFAVLRDEEWLTYTVSKR